MKIALSRIVHLFLLLIDFANLTITKVHVRIKLSRDVEFGDRQGIGILKFLFIHHFGPYITIGHACFCNQSPNIPCKEVEFHNLSPML